MARLIPPAFRAATLVALVALGCGGKGDSERASDLANWLSERAAEATQATETVTDTGKLTPTQVHDLAMDVAYKIEDYSIVGSPSRAKQFREIAQQALTEDDTRAALTRLEQAISSYVSTLTAEYGIDLTTKYEYKVF